MAGRQKATMQRVAESVGVSISTVSRVFNSPEFATPETRERVIEAAEQIGYIPLRWRQPAVSDEVLEEGVCQYQPAGSVVLLASEDVLFDLCGSQWIYRDVLPALQRATRKYGLDLVLSSFGQDDAWDQIAVNAKDVMGVLWMGNDHEELLARLSRTMPVVVLNDNSFWPPRTSVLASNRMVLFQAVEHLVEQGHRRIGYFEAEDNTNQHTFERRNAYHRAIGHFNLPDDSNLFIGERFGPNEHPQAIARAMDRVAAMKEPPTALIAPAGYSIQLLKETRKRGINVPNDLSVIAIDNPPEVEFVDPPLTAIDCAFGRSAEVSLEVLIGARGEPLKHIQNILVEPRLVVRKSTAKLTSS